MQTGRLDKRITIRRRAIVPNSATGNPRGDFSDAFTTWASFRQLTGRSLTEAALVEGQFDAIVKVRDSTQNRTITVADRAILEGVEFAIVTVGVPERIDNSITFTVSRQIGG